MGKLGIMDILSFAKAGYSPKDVKELLEIEVPDELLPPTNPMHSHKSPVEKKEPESAAKESANELPSQDDAKADDIDYKALYEKEVEKVKRLQTQNTNQDASGGEKEDPMKAVDDFLASFM